MAADDDLTTNHEVVSHEEWLAARKHPRIQPAE